MAILMFGKILCICIAYEYMTIATREKGCHRDRLSWHDMSELIQQRLHEFWPRPKKEEKSDKVISRVYHITTRIITMNETGEQEDLMFDKNAHLERKVRL
jgi:hypothetical protein